MPFLIQNLEIWNSQTTKASALSVIAMIFKRSQFPFSAPMDVVAYTPKTSPSITTSESECGESRIDLNDLKAIVHRFSIITRSSSYHCLLAIVEVLIQLTLYLKTEKLSMSPTEVSDF